MAVKSFASRASDLGRATFELFPSWFRFAFLGERSHLLAWFDQSVSAPKRHGPRLLLPLPWLRGDIEPLPKHLTRPVDVALPQSFAHKRSVEVPKVNTAQLQRLLRLDIEKNTPFEPDTIRSVHSAAATGKGNLSVTQWIVRRTDLAELDNRLSDAGLRPQRYFIDTCLGRELWQSSTSDRRFARAFPLINAACVIAIGCSFLYVASSNLNALDAAISERQRTLVALTEEAVALRQSIESKQGDLAVQQALAENLSSHVSLLGILRDVSDVLPDEIWVSDLQVSNGEVIVRSSIEGSAAQFLVELQSDERLIGPDLSGPITQASDQRERFDLKFRPRLGAGE